MLSWLYEVVLGIQRDEKHPGYAHFYLKPEPQKLTRARGSVASPYGVIRAGWEKEGEQYRYCCEIPVNTSATLCYPDGRTEELGSGKYEVIL